ncbi:MAG: type IV secretion system DNA-binding domain-containing protein, partial [Gammaproteobacteria bacterium]
MSKLLTALMNFRSRQAASFYESLEEKTFTIRMSPEMGRQVLGGLVALCAAAFLYFYFILKAHWQVSAYVVGHLTLFTLLSFMAITYLASGLRHGERFATLWKDASRPLTFTCYAWVSYLVMMVGLYYVLILDRTLPWKGEVVFPSGLAFLRFLYIGHSVVTLCLYWAALTVIFLSPYWVAVYYKWEYQRRYRGTARPEDFPFRLWIGKSTGALAKIAHGSGMPAKKQVCLSWQDATQNMVIFGGIGSGKTTRAIQPLLLQLMDKQCGGLIFDIKGNFQTAVEACAKATHSAKRLRIIGPHHEKLNLIEGLTPEVASSFLKSALMLANNKQNPFFIDTATELCRNALGVLSFLPQHYHLSGLYNYLFDNKKQKDMHEELEAVLSTIEHQTDKVRLLQTYQSYQEKIFSTYDDRIKSNILASVAQVLSPFNHPDLIDAFCSASTCKMEEVLNGTVFVVNLPLAVWGLGAKVASSF